MNFKTISIYVSICTRVLKSAILKGIQKVQNVRLKGLTISSAKIHCYILCMVEVSFASSGPKWLVFIDKPMTSSMSSILILRLETSLGYVAGESFKAHQQGFEVDQSKSRFRSNRDARMCSKTLQTG